MNWDRIEGNWKEFKGRVKQNWGQLTDDDIATMNGRRDELEGLLQKRYGLTKDRANAEVDSWLGTM
ncbi:MAG: CsbD family protein [Hyphomicrobiales bacterium]